MQQLEMKILSAWLLFRSPALHT